MEIERIKNIPIPGKHGRPVVTDVSYVREGGKKPVIMFCHGYKGFKDWGAWNLMAEAFARKGFFFIKFNFAYNGGTLEDPIDFPDLTAFGENTYIRELDDLEVVLDWLTQEDFACRDWADVSDITLMGHSRGGGIAVIKASEDARIQNLITLASVSDFKSRFPTGAEMEAWKKDGVAYILNARTGQKMPHLYEFYANFKENEERLTISRAARKLNIPFLIIHGTEDPTVDMENAEHLKEWVPQAKLLLLEGSNHVFEASHPWDKNELPAAIKEVVERSEAFIKKSQ